MEQIPFIIGDTPEIQSPLSRYLPPIPQTIARQWLLQCNLVPHAGNWILDPFGSSPGLAVEAAQAGFRILVTANNPISRFLIEMAASPPTTNDFQSGLAALATSLRGNERLENHIRSLYRMHCLECGNPVEVDAFLWEKNASLPYGSLYACDECGFQGEQPLPVEISEQAGEFSVSGLHHARALERVTSREDPDRIFVEEALSVYTPRAIYVLFILINKIDSLHLSVDQQRALQALILSACDHGNSMWGYPTQRERPRQLFVPPRHRENNIWKSMEQAVDLWTKPISPVQVSIWPEMPAEEGGICIYEGPLRDLSQLKGTPNQALPEIQAVLTSIPRPNQAFWTLSALWSGWLWGRDAVGPFKGVLRRRRYDWSWLNVALHAAFENLAQLVDPNIPIFGLTGEAEAGLLTSTLNAADRAGYRLTGLALRDEQAQIYWTLDPSRPIGRDGYAVKLANEAIRNFLIAYGQPAHYLKVWSAGLTGLFAGESGAKSTAVEPTEIEFGFSETTSLLKDVLTYRGGFLRFGSGEAIENSLWWLKEEPKTDTDVPFLSIIDKLEMALVSLLFKTELVNENEIERNLLQAFPGILTPDREWIQVILESYAVRQPDGDKLFKLRKEDYPASRLLDLETMQEGLHFLARKLGYAQVGENPVVWAQEGSNHYYFYLTASAVLSNIILKNETARISPAHKSLVVLPGGRANLVQYKIQHDPRLNRLCMPDEQTQQPGWRFLKMRHLRWLLDNASQSQNFDDLLSLDPLTFSAPQTRFL